MPTNTSALARLLPLAGAAALTVHGARGLPADRDTGRTSPTVPPRPIEVPDPDRPQPRRKKVLPDAACERCGTSIPGRERLCTPCERQINGAGNTAAATALHWLVFLVTMTAIIGGGWLLSQ